MREAGRDPQLAMVVGAQLDADPAAEGRAAAAHVDGDVEHRALRHAHQLALRVRRHLEVQPAQHARAPSANGCPARTSTCAPTAASNAFWLKLSKKKPRASPNTFGSMTSTPGSAVGVDLHQNTWSVGDLQQVLAVAVLQHRLRPALSSCSRSIQPVRQAISSGQATFRPWRFSSVAMNCPASSRLSWVPVSSQA